MRIVVLASRKGGSGKTTLAGHLAVQAELSGAGPVALYQISMIIAPVRESEVYSAESPALRGVTASATFWPG